jgi:glutamate synthase domain-containing protein 3
MNGLRSRVRLRTDGGLKTAEDIVVAAMLGAEEFGFGTSVLVAIGCDMARQCHLNTCPTGVASQRPDLRAKFKGTPESVMRYLLAVAGEIREILASLGVRALDEVIGRSDLLVQRERPTTHVDLSGLLKPALPVGSRRHWTERNERPGLVSLDEEMLRDILPCLDTEMPFSGSYPVRNHHLTVGGRVAGVLAQRFGRQGLPPGRLRFRFHGYAGQSFGAFAVRGMQLDLEGEANDYVGKGLSGGEISIRPFRHAAHAAASHQNQILGNTSLYGATSGRLFAAGMAGDRFAVRNSGVVAVVEGCGNHGCEYMTGGVVVVLGRAGRNFGAGMSNGLAYVIDEGGTFRNRLNTELVTCAPLDEDDERLLRLLVEEHGRRTISPRAQSVLAAWESYVTLFRKVVPKDDGAHERVAAIRDELLGRVRVPVEATDAVA